MAAGALPFRFLAGGAAGVVVSGSEIFCLFVRLCDRDLGGSGSGIGLVSRAEAFRFRDAVEGREREEDVAGVAEAAGGGVSGVVAACLADLRVILEDMSDLFCKLRSLRAWT